MSRWQLLAELNAEFGGLERGFWHTAGKLVAAPGVTVRQVWSGKASTITTPIRFFLVSYSLGAFVYIWSGAKAVYVSELETDHGSSNPALVTFMSALITSPLLASLLSLLFVFLACWPFFRSRGVNEAECGTLSLYACGVLNLIAIPLMPLAWTRWDALAAAAIGTGYFGWLAADVFEGSKFRLAARGASWYLVSQLALGLVVVAMILSIESLSGAG